MKFVFHFFIMFILTESALCQANRNLNVRLTTKVTHKEKLITNYDVLLYSGLNNKDSVFVLNSLPKILYLNTNKLYTLYYRKKGLAGKYIIIDTKVPEKATTLKFNVHIHVELDPESSKQKENTDDFPSAIIKYDAKLKNFEYVKNFHKQVHR